MPRTRAPPRAPASRHASISAATRASSQPISGAIARATRRTPSASSRRQPRGVEQAQPRSPQQHIRNRARLLAARREGRLGHEVRAGRESRGAPARGSWPPVRARRARRGRSAPASASREASSTPSTSGSSAGAIGIPSGISRVRQGASRPSRSTIRSTAILAIRRQVVSLPPVMVTSPELVS